MFRKPGFWKDKVKISKDFDAVSLMSNLSPKKLPFDQFLKTFELVPRVAVNLLVVRKDGAVLLTRRKKPPFPGAWHMPGSFLLKGEALMECVHRVEKEELGIEISTMARTAERLNGQKNKQQAGRIFELSGVFDDLKGDPRGHVVDLVYRCKLKSNTALQGPTLRNRKVGPFEALKSIGDTAEMRFFKTLPKNIGFNHRETLASLGYT